MSVGEVKNPAENNLSEQIKEAYATEQMIQPVAVLASDIPISYASITPAWMSAILCANHPGAQVVHLELGPRDSGTSNRRRIEIAYNSIGQSKDLPTSVFCKATHELVNRLTSGHSGGIHCEVTFYRRVRNLLDIAAPRAYLANYDPKSFNSIVMLEDLTGKATYCSHKTDVPRARAESQMKLLAKFHGRFYESAELKTTLGSLPTWYDRFHGLARFNLEKCCANGFRDSQEVMPDRLYKRAAEVWPATLASVDRHRFLPHTLNHGDVHLKNWYITEQGMGLGDWQVTCRGNWSRDFAYTISTALKIEDRRRWERELLTYYLEQLRAAGGPVIDFDDAWRYYRQQLPSVLAFWTLTLTPSSEMPDMQPRDTTIEFISRIAHAMDDLDSLDTLQ